MTDVYLAWCGLVEAHRSFLERIAVRCDLSLERLLQSSLICIALHDLGKLSDNFQGMMRAPDEHYRRACKRNYRHEIAGLWFVKKAVLAVVKEYGPVPGGGWLEVLAVAGHHKYLADGYLFQEALFEQQLNWKPDAWSAVRSAYQLAEKMFKAQGWRLPFPDGVKPSNVKAHLRSFPDNSPYTCLIGARSEAALLFDLRPESTIPRILHRDKRDADGRRLDGQWRYPRPGDA